MFCESAQEIVGRTKSNKIWPKPRITRAGRSSLNAKTVCDVEMSIKSRYAPGEEVGAENKLISG